MKLVFRITEDGFEIPAVSAVSGQVKQETFFSHATAEKL
jgi:hypothetical protein